MPSTSDLRLQAWNPVQVRQLARELADLAAAQLTHDGSGPVRPPDFSRRARQILKRRFTAAEIPAIVRELAEAGLHLNHPRYMAQQVAAPVPVAALVESVVGALNQSLAVWDMSPAAMYIDRDLISRFRTLFDYSQAAEGSLVPGGSFANLTAMLAARAALQPTAWKKGGGKIAVLTGAHTHYSISRAIGIMGLGTDCVFPIPTDERYRTDARQVAAQARKARAAGYRRFILVGSCGATATGSCDDLPTLAAQARKLRAWFHVDAAHGGGFAFSRRMKSKLNGIEAADSMIFDPHKMLFMPLTAGAVLVRDGRHLRNSFEQHAPYLFGGAGERACPDLGPITVACSQRFDALKVWLTWKAYSGRLWGDLVDATCAATRAGYEYCLASSLLEPVHEPDCNIFCYRLRQPPRSVEKANELHWQIKEAVNQSGEASISSTVLDGRRVLRLVVMNPRTRPQDVCDVLAMVEEAARRLG